MKFGSSWDDMNQCMVGWLILLCPMFAPDSPRHPGEFGEPRISWSYVTISKVSKTK